jgi:phage terminase large subunit GpA-like protein
VIEATQRELLLEAFAGGFRPPPRMTVDEWADEFRILDTKSSAFPGKWRTDRTPYAREPMRRLSVQDPCKRVVLMWGAQLSKTEIGLNWAGYVMDLAPAPMLLVQSTVKLAQAYSKTRLAPMIAAAPQLAERVADPKSRDSGNTLEAKEFPGGVVYLRGANSPSGLRATPIRDLHLDEIDSFPATAGTEGDPCDLAEARTNAFPNRKILVSSTPTIKGESPIEAAYLATDQNRFWVPCLECGEFQILEWAQIQWPAGKPRRAVYVCVRCGSVLENHQKPAMLRRGEWRPEAEYDGETHGYRLSGLYSPFLSWGEAAKKWVKAQGDPFKLQVVVNTVLAQTWDLCDGETIDGHELMARREEYAAEVPAGVGVLTAGTDVHHTRLECDVWGWGEGQESWNIAHIVVEGDPTGRQVWESLQAILDRDWHHELGPVLRIDAMCVDSGDNTQAVYDFTTPRADYRVWAIKGRAGAYPVWPAASSRKTVRAQPVWRIGVDAAKAQLFGRLQIEAPGPGHVHFPIDRDGDWFDQLTAERRRTRYSKGRAIHYWWKPDRQRNEALDCWVYAYAALEGWLAQGRTIGGALRAIEARASGERSQRVKSKRKKSWLGPRRKHWLR